MELLRDTRGAVMAEGVIVLPVFIIIFASVIYLHGAYSSKLEASVSSRGCAWAYATAGCPDKDHLPDICKDSAIAKNAGALEQFSELGEMRMDLQDMQSSIAGGVAQLGGVAAALLGIGDGVSITTSRKHDRPPILGGKEVSVSSTNRVLCNEKPRTVLDVIQRAYCGVTDSLPGC